MLGANIHRACTDGKAVAKPVYYFDRLTVWLTEPLSPQHVRRLRRLCGYQHTCRKAMRHNPEYTMRLQACQPSREYLRALLAIEQAQRIRINYVEIARDECWQSRAALEDVKEHRDEHELRLWHPKRQEARAYDDSQGNAYDAARKKSRVLTRYMEPHSRITGECDSLHTEFRVRGTQSVQRAGIYNVRGLIDFDHVAWWQSKTRVVTTPDLERLGRLVRNRRDNTRDRSALLHVSRCGRHVFEFNCDYRLGSALTAGFSNTQAFVDYFGGVSRLQQAGVFVSVGGLSSGASNSKCDAGT